MGGGSRGGVPPPPLMVYGRSNTSVGSKALDPPARLKTDPPGTPPPRCNLVRLKEAQQAYKCGSIGL